MTYSLTLLENLASLYFLTTIFSFIVELFSPFYAYSSKAGEINYSYEYQEKSKKFGRTKLPIAIEWFNYFDSDWTNRLGGFDKLQGSSAYRVTRLGQQNGSMLILQREPFDYRNENHIKKRLQVEKDLELTKLLTLSINL